MCSSDLSYNHSTDMQSSANTSSSITSDSPKTITYSLTISLLPPLSPSAHVPRITLIHITHARLLSHTDIKKAAQISLSCLRWRRPTLPHVTAVPSALKGLTSLFGMGRGGTPSLLPPKSFINFFSSRMPYVLKS